MTDGSFKNDPLRDLFLPGTKVQKGLYKEKKDGLCMEDSQQVTQNWKDLGYVKNKN